LAAERIAAFPCSAWSIPCPMECADVRMVPKSRSHEICVGFLESRPSIMESRTAVG
jgi:hypothetical protein